MDNINIYLGLLSFFHVAGIVCAVHALLSVRTPQGTTGWVISLLALPPIALPAYLIFGRSRFKGFIFARQSGDLEVAELLSTLRENGQPFMHNLKYFSEGFGGQVKAMENLVKMPLLTGNKVELLVNGEDTFSSIFEGIEKASDYILIQFYIVKNDELGTELQQRLLAKARQGVRIYFLFDELGSNKLPSSYVEKLQSAGVRIHSFQTTRGSGNRFQLNFRNHRKVVVVDGCVGWVGGHNVGDEYLGKTTRFGGWRDTHVAINGPAVLSLQFAFMEDWYWATSEKLRLCWDFIADETENSPVLILPSGPADRLPTASLMFQHVIHSAQKRIWIATPYFIPDDGVINALQLAKIRGVDVRILIPDQADHLLVHLSAFAFFDRIIQSGIEIYRYTAGFMHQKVFIVDNFAAAVGTANLDNRSFRLNFEVTAIVQDKKFVALIDRMLRDDFEHSRKMTQEEIESKSFWFKICARAAYLTAPIQ